MIVARLVREEGVRGLIISSRIGFCTFRRYTRIYVVWIKSSGSPNCPWLRNIIRQLDCRSLRIPWCMYLRFSAYICIWRQLPGGQVIRYQILGQAPPTTRHLLAGGGGVTGAPLFPGGGFTYLGCFPSWGPSGNFPKSRVGAGFHFSSYQIWLALGFVGKNAR